MLVAPAAEINRQEWARASVVLYEMAKVNLEVVGAEIYRKDEKGYPIFLNTWCSETNVLARYSLVTRASGTETMRSRSP